MTVLEAIILGTLQGLTEFLPVSSSGHLVLARHFLDVQEAGVFFDVMLHLGTLGAVAAVYGREVSRQIRERLNLFEDGNGPGGTQGLCAGTTAS